EGLNAIMNETVEKGIFRGVKVGTNQVTVSHLQYADDTIFFGEWNKENAKSLMRERIWYDIVKIREEIDRVGLEFTSVYVGEVGDGRDIRFWVDRWVDNRRLYDRFPRLFHLDSRKEGSVMDKILWVNNGWVWAWDCVRINYDYEVNAADIS
ncbi:hypothetical protein Tco_1331288, partial [Tanacetum coccineum]